MIINNTAKNEVNLIRLSVAFLLRVVIKKKLSMEQKIIVVDDNSVALRKLREILTREGYSVMTAMNQKTADDICNQINVDYMLIKVSMYSQKDKSIKQKP